MKISHLLRALAVVSMLAVFSCGKDIDITPGDNPVQGTTYTITITAVKGEVATRAFTLEEGSLISAWTAGDKVAVYNKTRNAALSGELEAQSGGASTTLSGSVSGTIEPSDVLLLEFLSPDFAGQDGTLEYIAAHCDYAQADVTVASTEGGKVTTTAEAIFENQQAVVRFNLKESDAKGTAIDGVSHLVVNTGIVEITVTPVSPTNILYVALPALEDGSLSLEATAGDGTRRVYSMEDFTLENSTYREISARMAFLILNGSDLLAANEAGVSQIVLGADVTAGGITVNGTPVIDLKGYSITGGQGGIFVVGEGKSLTLNGPGTLKGGHRDQGGAIFNNGGTVTLKDVIITGCSADEHGGAIYNAGTLNMSGTIVAIDNTPENVYLAEGSVITVVGPFVEGAGIGVAMAERGGSITSGFSAHNASTDPSAVFSPDEINRKLVLEDGEARLVVWYDYTVTEEKTYANLKTLLGETGYDISVVEPFLPTFFPSSNDPVSAISYTYRSIDPQGSPVELSALIYIPDAALDGSQPLTGISLTNHATIASNAECPTMHVQLEGALAWRNYAMIMPDYYGFGVSADRPQAFLDPETTARGNIDGYFAALQLLQDRKVEIPERVYSFGYSQGGFNAMANLKYVSAHPELGIHFQKVICGGSPFNVERTWMEYTKEDSAFRSAVAFVPLTMVSINESHKLSIDYSQLFKGNLLDNWQDWILSKKNSLSQLNRLLGTTDLSEILNDDFMAGKGEAYEKIMDVCRSYSLTTGWTPPSDTYIILFHSTSDDIVPYANYQEMTAFLESAGVQKGTGPGYYYSIDGNYEGHVDAAAYYIVYTIFEW